MIVAGARRKSKSKSGEGRSVLRRWLKRLAFLCLAIILLPFVLIAVYAVVPPVSTLMIKDVVTGRGYKRNWTPLDKIATVAAYSVLVSEDARHCAHNGVDWIEMKNAWDSILKGGRGRGASTITMQTVKNLFLWNSRSFVRKGLELPLALFADLVWSKRRTLEIYLNIAEWDKGVYGIDAAARHYYKVPAASLNRTRSALLAVTLPNPVKRNPKRPSRGLNRLARKIIARTRAAGPYVGCLKPS